MLKVVFLAIGTGLIVATSPANAHGQCLSFSRDVACAAKPSIRANFGVTKTKPPVSVPTPAELARQAAATKHAPREAGAIDCQMVRKVDPSFHSNMPVVTPDPNVNFVITVVPVPSCAP